VQPALSVLSSHACMHAELTSNKLYALKHLGLGFLVLCRSCTGAPQDKFWLCHG